MEREMKSRDIQEAPGWVSVGCGFLTPEREGFAYSGERRVGARLPAAQTKDKEVVQLRSSLPLLVWRSCTWDLGMRGQGG